MDTDETRSELPNITCWGWRGELQRDKRIVGSLGNSFPSKEYTVPASERDGVSAQHSYVSPYVHSVHDFDPVVPRQIALVQVDIDADLQISGSDRPNEYQNVGTHILQLLSL